MTALGDFYPFYARSRIPCLPELLKNQQGLQDYPTTGLISVLDYVACRQADNNEYAKRSVNVNRNCNQSKRIAQP